MPNKTDPRTDTGRRRFLQAAGATVCLPWMESLAASSGGLRREPAKPPVRLACLFMPNGVHVPSWEPKQAGSDWELTPTLRPLASLRDELFVLTGLRNKNSYSGEGHYVKTTALLSGARVKKTGGHDIRCGTSVDQFAAQHIGNQTPLASMQLAIDPVSNVVDMGYSTVYGAHISWRTPTVPAPREIHPKAVFDRLFHRSRLGNARNRMVLDVVLEDARRLAKTLAGADKDKFSEYLDSVQAVEKRINQFTEERVAESKDLAAGRRPSDLDPNAYADRVRLMLEMIVLAFRSDTTRLSTFMFGNSVSSRNFSFVEGVRGGFHPFSHHQNDPEKERQYALINRWHVEQYAWLLSELAKIKEGDKTLLDQSMVFFGSGIGDGNSHNPRSLPVLLAGRGGGVFKPGRHLVFKKDRRLCNLHLSMLHALGVREDRFGDSRGVITDLA